jgi:hypothetical protein
MPLKNDWQNGDLFTPAAANDMANVVNAFGPPTATGQAVVTAANATAARAAIGASGQLHVNVKDYGAVGNGVTDDTTAIEAAYAAAGSAGAIFFPPGQYVYNGSGLNSPAGNRIRISGAANSSSTILLGADSYFINYTVLLASTVIKDLAFSGGKGAFKHTFTGTNVAGIHLVENCFFGSYTECAIATDSADMPYWHIRDCTFNAANTTNTIGIAFGSGMDDCIVESCLFMRNRIHIKGRRGNNFHVKNCELIWFSSDNSGGPRSAIWIVPSDNNINAGHGMTITGGRFGNESLVAGDYRILFADELSGSSNGTRFPQLAADSTGFVTGVTVAHSNFWGISATSHPMIYSTTPNVRFLQVHNNVTHTSLPSYVVEFRTPSTTADRLNSTNIFGPFVGDISTESALPYPASNDVGLGYWVDPQGMHQRSGTIRNWPSGSSASFKQILSAAITSFTATLVSKSNTTDAYGGADAVTLTMDNISGLLSSALTVDLVIGLPMWVEFDVANTNDGNTAEKFNVFVRDDPSSFHMRRCVEVPSVDKGWVTYAFCFTPRTTGQRPTRLMFGAANSADVGKTVKIGRPRVYQANERQMGGRRPTVAAAATTQLNVADLANDLRNDLIALGIVSGTPSSGSVTADALGTPVSGTLTNCTGLPVSGITASTSTALGLGSVELGHASDTTLSRSAAGVLAVEGVEVPTVSSTSTLTNKTLTSPVLTTPTLGTPSSGTLTNCTGLPVSGITATTSTALGVGSLEVGHASDTTVSRSSAGVLAVEGVEVPTVSSTSTLTNKTLTSPVLTTPTLGTPSSGTLTNCTELPVSSITASTSSALGVGSVELGHATDTTLSRSSAGVLAVEGVAVPTVSSTNTLTNKTVTEIVFAITDGAAFSIDPANGGIQTLTLGASRTPVGSFSSGQSVLMHVAATTYTITWTDSTLNPTWIGGTAPSLSSTQQTVIAFWKVGSTIYGSLVGYA